MGMCADLLDQLWHVGAARIGPAGPPSGGVPSGRRDEGRVVTCATNLHWRYRTPSAQAPPPPVTSASAPRGTLNLGTGPAARFLSVCIYVHLRFRFLLFLRRPHRVGRLVIQRLTHRVHDGLQALHPPEPFEVRFHNGPWRGERARPQQHIFHGFVVAAPFLAVAPILRRQLPALVRRVLALLEPFQLFFGTDLQPELHHHGAGVHKLPLEIVDLTIGPLPGVLRAESLHALHQHAAVPAPVEDHDLFFVGRQQPPPEAPQVMVRLVLALGRGDRKDFVAARVQLFRQPPDVAALARRIASFKHRHQRALAPVELPRQLAQLHLVAQQVAIVFRPRKASAQIQSFQHGYGFRAARLSAAAFSARIMASKTAMRVQYRSVASTMVHGPHSDSVRSSISSTATRYLPYSLWRFQSACCTCQRVSGWLSSFLNRCLCSFLLMWKKSFTMADPSSASVKKSFTMAYPSSASVRSKSVMSRYAFCHSLLGVIFSTRSSSTRRYQLRSKMDICP